MNVRFNLFQPASREVRSYIEANHKEQLDAVSTFAHQHIVDDPHRMQHLIHVGRQGERIAFLGGFDTTAQAHAYMAGVVHDSVRLEDPINHQRNAELMAQLLELAEQQGVHIIPEDRKYPYHLHGRAAAEFGKSVGLHPTVTDGPEYHTPGIPLEVEEMSLEAAILIVADKSSIDRDSQKIQKVSGILQQDNYSETSIFLAALYVMLKNQRKEEKGKEPYHPYVTHTVESLEKQLGLDSLQWNSLTVKDKKTKIKSGEALELVKNKDKVLAGVA